MICGYIWYRLDSFWNILNGQNEFKLLFFIPLCTRVLFIFRKNPVRTSHLNCERS